MIFHQDYSHAVADLRHLGIRPPCLIKGEQYIPIAFYAGCASAPGLRPPRLRATTSRSWRTPGSTRPGTRATGCGTGCPGPEYSVWLPTCQCIGSRIRKVKVGGELLDHAAVAFAQHVQPAGQVVDSGQAGVPGRLSTWSS